MSSRQYHRSNQGITRNVRQSIKKDFNNSQSVASTDVSNRVPTNVKSESVTTNNQNRVRSDEAVKINKILNLLNQRLRDVETKTSQLYDNTSVNFEGTISLTKMNTLFSLMNSRILALEKQNKLSNLKINLGTEEDVEDSELLTTKLDELINSNNKISDIEKSISSLTSSVSNINLNGITNNFVKLNNLIQTIKKDMFTEIQELKTSLKRVENSSSVTSNNIVEPKNKEDVTEETAVVVVNENKEDTVSETAMVATTDDTLEKENNIESSNSEATERENIKISLEDENLEN